MLLFRCFQVLGSFLFWVSFSLWVNGQMPPKPQSSEQDSAQKKKVIPPKILTINPSCWLLFSADSARYRVELEDFIRWDEGEQLPYFSWNLGQIGKPYRHFVGAFSDEYQLNNAFKNPFTRQNDVYGLGAGTLKYFDTRTPYLKGRFDQASRKVQLLDVEVSQNVLPIWNSTVTFRRRTATGVYLNNTTDHVTTSWTNYFRSFDGRYKGTLAGYYAQLNDELNGGVYLDSTGNIENSFLKQAQSVALAGTKYTRRTKGLQTNQLLLLRPDSVFYNLGISLKANWQHYFQQYADPAFLPKDTLRYGSYPWKEYSTLFIDYHNVVINKSLTPGIVCKLKNLSVNLNTLIQQDQFVIQQDSFYQQTRAYIGNVTFLSPTIGRFSGSAQLSTKSIQGKESLFQIEYFFAPQKTIEIVILDTLAKRLRKKSILQHLVEYTPHTVQLTVSQYSLAPAIIHLRNFGSTIASLGNSFKPEQFSQVRAEYSRNFTPKLHRNRYVTKNFISINAYFQQLANQIFPDTALRYHQNEGLTTAASVQLSGKYQWRFLNIQPTISYVSFLQNNSAAASFNRSQPKLRFSCDLYFKQDVFNQAANLLVGLRSVYLDSYSLPRFDPASQQFFPDFSLVKTWSYLRLDAFLALSIKTVKVYARLIHLNEGMSKPGYMTVLGYPMLERTFSFGVEWRFFD